MRRNFTGPEEECRLEDISAQWLYLQHACNMPVTQKTIRQVAFSQDGHQQRSIHYT